MEIIEVVGIRNVDFTDKNKRQIVGSSVYYLIDDENVNGKMCGKLFVSEERAQHMSYFPEVGDIVAVSYDRFGKPVDFKLIK